MPFLVETTSHRHDQFIVCGHVPGQAATGEPGLVLRITYSGQADRDGCELERGPAGASRRVGPLAMGRQPAVGPEARTALVGQTLWFHP